MAALTSSNNNSDAFLQNLAHLRNQRENTPANSSNSGKNEEIVLLEKQGRSSQKLRNNNVFTVAKRNVEGQDMLYQSIKLTNGIWVLAELKILKGRTIAFLGVAFKENTDDLRDAPSIDIARNLIERGVKVRAHDPVALENARRQ